MLNAWQDYTALIFAFYNRSGIIMLPSFYFLHLPTKSNKGNAV